MAPPGGACAVATCGAHHVLPQAILGPQAAVEPQKSAWCFARCSRRADRRCNSSCMLGSSAASDNVSPGDDAARWPEAHLHVHGASAEDVAAMVSRAGREHR